MKNQHEPTTEGESEENNGGVKRKNNTATNFKRKKTPGTFRELKKIIGCTNNNVGVPSITLLVFYLSHSSLDHVVVAFLVWKNRKHQNMDLFLV